MQFQRARETALNVQAPQTRDCWRQESCQEIRVARRRRKQERAQSAIAPKEERVEIEYRGHVSVLSVYVDGAMCKYDL